MVRVPKHPCGLAGSTNRILTRQEPFWIGGVYEVLHSAVFPRLPFRCPRPCRFARRLSGGRLPSDREKGTRRRRLLGLPHLRQRRAPPLYFPWHTRDGGGCRQP